MVCGSRGRGRGGTLNWVAADAGSRFSGRERLNKGGGKGGRNEEEGQGGGVDDKNLGEKEDEHADHDKDGDPAPRSALLFRVVERLWEDIKLFQELCGSLHFGSQCQ